MVCLSSLVAGESSLVLIFDASQIDESQMSDDGLTGPDNLLFMALDGPRL